MILFKKAAFPIFTNFEYGWVWGGLLYFSMAFLAFKGQFFFIRQFLFTNVGHGWNLVLYCSPVPEIQNRAKTIIFALWNALDFDTIDISPSHLHWGLLENPLYQNLTLVWSALKPYGLWCKNFPPVSGQRLTMCLKAPVICNQLTRARVDGEECCPAAAKAQATWIRRKKLRKYSEFCIIIIIQKTNLILLSENAGFLPLLRTF